MSKYENKDVSSVMLLPKSILPHIKNASAAELKVIIHIFANGGEVENSAGIANELGISESECEAAIAFWRGAGIVDCRTQKTADEKAAVSDENPVQNVTVLSDTPIQKRTYSYDAAALADAMEHNEDYRSLYNFACNKLEKILTPTDQSCLFTLVDAYGMPCDLVMGIIEYCVSKGKNTVRYIERTAESLLENEGIDTFEKLEEYVSRKKSNENYENAVKKMIGAENRSLTKTESKIVGKWADKNIDKGLLEEAYSRTITNIAKPSLGYMEKIIDRWCADGVKTPADLENQKPFFPSGAQISVEGGFSLDDFTEKPQ